MNENLFSFSAISGQGEQPKFDSTAFDLGSDVNAPPPPAAVVPPAVRQCVSATENTGG